MNDLPNCVDKLSVWSFADDTNLFYSSDNVKQLESVMNRELKQIYNYCALNKLSINTAKTNYMLVSSFSCHPKINITGIEQKDYIKYLGVYIDKHLNWQPQIQQKSKICCFIHRMRNETDSIPDIFLDVLTSASRIHNHNTRFVSNLNYFRPRVSTNLGKTSFKFSAPKVWETVAPGLKCLPYHKFKKEWKSYLLTNQI